MKYWVVINKNDILLRDNCIHEGDKIALFEFKTKKEFDSFIDWLKETEVTWQEFFVKEEGD